MVAVDASDGGGTTILTNETLPQAANAWARLLPPYDRTLMPPFGIPGISPSPGDLSTEAALSATTDWGNIYEARYNRRQEGAYFFVAACVTSWQILTAADQTGGDKIASVTSGGAGPIVA